MTLLELFLLAIGLSMDAFAVAICKGLAMAKVTVKKALTVGLYFCIFQAVMPLIGFMIATQFADKIIAYDHWIAFVLLCFIGGKMITESRKKESRPVREGSTEICADRDCLGQKQPDKQEASLKPAQMLPLAVATSIDALAVGVSFAFLRADIIPAVTIIGATTLLLSMIGVKIGNLFGKRYKSKAELAGGIILVLIGVKILLDHLYI
jgi:putative Mn2+ efflux pump MntP